MTDNKNIKVALLVGGWSAEREVSLTKGKKVEVALKEAGFDVNVIDVQKDLSHFQKSLEPKPDVVFNNLHGRGGEDGTIQAVLDMMGIPYTHSNMLASAVAMDKALTKRLAQSCGVMSPQWIVLPLNEIKNRNPVPTPFVVKPVNEGSSVGVYIIKDQSNFSVSDMSDWEFDQDVLVEQYIPGRELTVAVLDGKAQAVTEIKSEASFFNYDAKYTDQTTEYQLPADIPGDIYNKALDNAERLFKLLECSGLARCDFRYNDTGHGPKGLYFLEINTQPGLTAESIGPSQVIHNGKSFPELCAHLVHSAIKNAKDKSANQLSNSQTCQSENHESKKTGEADSSQALEQTGS